MQPIARMFFELNQNSQSLSGNLEARLPFSLALDAAEHARASLALPCDLFGDILAFTPLSSFPAIALCCRTLARSVKAAIQANEKEAKKSLQEGLRLITNTSALWDAVEFFRRASAMNPRLIEAYYWEAKALDTPRDGIPPMEVLHHALRQQLTDTQRYQLQACILYTNNDDMAASKLLEAAILLTTTDACLYFDLAYCYHGLSQYRKAIDCYTAALELNHPRSFVALKNRAECLYNSGMMEEALQDLKACLEICPGFDPALKIQACVHTAMGQGHRAYEYWTTIIEKARGRQAKCEAYYWRAFCIGDVDTDDIEEAGRIDPVCLYELTEMHNARWAN